VIETRIDTMNKAFVYRIYPTEKQKKFFAKTFGCVRFIYNKILHDKMQGLLSTGKYPEYKLTDYKKQFPFLYEADSLALCNAEIAIKNAYANFRDKQKTGPKFTKKKLAHLERIGKKPTLYDMNGHPKFKSKKETEQSYSTNNQKNKKSGKFSVRLEGNYILLPKVGLVKIKLHRPLEQNSTIKTVTITKTHSDKYFVSILVEYENQILPVIPETFVGLDFAMDGLYVDSEGNRANYPKFYRKALKKLKRISRKFSRTKDKSNNHEKIRLKEAKLQEYVANCRNDFQHKLANTLVAQYDCICIEDLDMQGMGQALRLGKSVSDNAWGIFTLKLAYKLAWTGKHLVKIDKWYPSSHLCSDCGYKNRALKNLRIREWICPQCGEHHFRDYNAAINIRNEGQRIISA